MRKKIDFDKIPDRDKAERLRKEFEERCHQNEWLKDLQENLKLEYRYFKFFSLNLVASVSIGYKFDLDGDVFKIKYAIALKSKNDDFNRKFARDIINIRFNRGQIATFTVDKHLGVKNIPLFIATHYNNQIRTDPYRFGISKVPKHLSQIPIRIGVYV